MLRNVPLFAGLTEEELSFLADRLGKRAFGKGVIIFHEGSLGETLYIIEAGKVRIFALTESGQEISVNIYGQGEVFGELSVLDGLPRSAGAVAIEDTVCLTLQRDELLQFLENCPRVALSIIRVLSARLRYTTQYAESLAFLDVCGRVAAKLLELGERYGVKRDGIEIELRLTQGELASWVGTSRESVNKVLRMFQGQGLIEVKDLKITLLDRRGLKRLIVY
jgi:CRP-like cAMP-binding protein